MLSPLLVIVPTVLTTVMAGASVKATGTVSVRVITDPLGLVPVAVVELVYPVSLVLGVTRTVKVIVSLAPTGRSTVPISRLMLPATVPV